MMPGYLLDTNIVSHLIKQPQGVVMRRIAEVGESAVFAGTSHWMQKVVCDPHVEPGEQGAFRLWFGGGSVAHPAENVAGAIGYATLELAPTDLPARQ